MITGGITCRPQSFLCPVNLQFIKKNMVILLVGFLTVVDVHKDLIPLCTGKAHITAVNTIFRAWFNIAELWVKYIQSNVAAFYIYSIYKFSCHTVSGYRVTVAIDNGHVLPYSLTKRISLRHALPSDSVLISDIETLVILVEHNEQTITMYTLFGYWT